MQAAPASQHPDPLAHALVEHFTRALQRAGVELVPEREYEVEYEALDGPQRVDAIVRLKDDPHVVLAIECKRNAFPRDIRSALWQLEEYARHAASSGGVVVRALLAERLSPGAREALRHRGVAFFDESGTLFFRHGPTTIDIDREPPPEKRSRPGTPFVGAREQVVHALLHMGNRWFTGQELAQLATTSAYTVSQTLHMLQQHGWVEGQSAGRNAQRRLIAAGALLDAWADSWKARPEETSTWFAFASKPGMLATQVASRLQSAGRSDWAYTGAAAGNALVALLTTVDRLQIIVRPGAAAQVAAGANLTSAEQGSNVSIVERSGASEMFWRPLPESDTPLASPFIIYLDLLKDERGRNKELALELRKRVLKI
jgi:hypothetical protein